MIIDCISDLPKHHSLHISHNQHKDYYEKLSDYIETRMESGDIAPDDLKECLEKDELWEVQLYPITPISFYWAGAATLERACEITKEAMKQDGRA
jgi:hypothetical protein